MSEEQKKDWVRTPVIDNKCIWCGACIAICDEVFDFDDEEWKAIVKQWVNLKDCTCIDDAISACPVDAITY